MASSAVHSWKGMAATMGFTPLAELAHRAENLLDAVRAEAAVKPEHFELLFRSVDELEDGVARATTGKGLRPEAASLVKALDAAVRIREVPLNRRGRGRRGRRGRPARSPRRRRRPRKRRKRPRRTSGHRST
jgi:chemotaxis protein histidine kinase CheA